MLLVCSAVGLFTGIIAALFAFLGYRKMNLQEYPQIGPHADWSFSVYNPTSRHIRIHAIRCRSGRLYRQVGANGYGMCPVFGDTQDVCVILDYPLAPGGIFCPNMGIHVRGVLHAVKAKAARKFFCDPYEFDIVLSPGDPLPERPAERQRAKND